MSEQIKHENNMRPVEETTLGLYVWEMPDGRWVGDDQGNYMNIPAVKGDREKIERLTEAARMYVPPAQDESGKTIKDSFGRPKPEGQPLFLSGQRRVTDEELEEQRGRLTEGLVPDPYDIPALVEELKQSKNER